MYFRNKPKVSDLLDTVYQNNNTYLTRFMFGGSLRPDSAWEPRADRAGHVLPGVLQLRHEMSQAQALFSPLMP